MLKFMGGVGRRDSYTKSLMLHFLEHRINSLLNLNCCNYFYFFHSKLNEFLMNGHTESQLSHQASVKHLASNHSPFSNHCYSSFSVHVAAIF